MQHSNRPIAVLIGAVVLALAGWLMVTAYGGATNEAVPVPTTVPQTTVPQPVATATADSTPWWSGFVGPDEVNVEIIYLDSPVPRSTFLFISEYDDGRSPLVRRVDRSAPNAAWEYAGSPNTRWAASPLVTDRLILVVDTDGALHRIEPETGRGGIRPNAVVDLAAYPFLWSYNFGEIGRVVLLQLEQRGLTRIDPETTDILWSRPELLRASQPGRTADGDRSVVVVGADGMAHLDPVTGATLAPIDRPSPPVDCLTAYGEELSLQLSQPDPPTECVVVAPRQAIFVQNKDRTPLILGPSLGMPTTITLGPDDRIDVNSVADFGPGPNEFAADPFRMPIIWVMEEVDSPTFRFPLHRGRMGPVEPGMTLAEASDLLGLRVRPSRTAIPGCLVAVVEGDPYSPILILDVEDAETIDRIVDRFTSTVPSCL